MAGEGPAPAPFLPPGGRPWDRLFHVRAGDGVGLRCALWNEAGPRGHVVFLTGRAEFLEKVALPAAELARMGFAVVSLDWRGQGGSDRLVAPNAKGHVGDFAEYRTDLAALLAAPEAARLAGPRVVVAHSMGGAVAVGAMLRGRLDAAALVLSAPMFGIALTRLYRATAWPMAAAARRLGWRTAWPPVEAPERPYVFQGFDDNLLTGDRAVFGWMAAALRREPKLQLGMPTLGWLAAAFEECARLRVMGRLPVPALILLGSREAVVDPDAMRATSVRLGAELVEIEGGRHELLIEEPALRAAAWRAVAAFLEAHDL